MSVYIFGCYTVVNASMLSNVNMITLTLPSTASAKDYPDNTVSTYKTRLLEPLKLTGKVEYEVGLAEIQ